MRKLLAFDRLKVFLAVIVSAFVFGLWGQVYAGPADDIGLITADGLIDRILHLTDFDKGGDGSVELTAAGVPAYMQRTRTAIPSPDERTAVRMAGFEMGCQSIRSPPEAVPRA